jgi:sugar lactone lactonase YvrE
MGMNKIAASTLLALSWTLQGGSFAAADPPPVLGTRPTYTSAQLADVPNAAAIQARLWAPGLNEGYVPQGLALVEGAVLIAGYHSTQRGQDRGPCRVFRVDPATGSVTGFFDVPAECGHAGGLAYDGAGRLYVVDTKVALAVDLARALQAQHAKDAISQTLQLTGDVRGSLSTFHDGALWIGSWNSAAPGAIFRFPQQTLLGMTRDAKLSERQATLRLELPPKAQGAAFDGEGRLWVALSNTQRGQLAVLDGRKGTPIATYDVAPGIEGIAFASPTRLWAVAEVGSQRWLGGIPFHPLVFALDPAQLK